MFLAIYNTPVLDHLSFLPDLAACDIYLFPKVKYTFKEIWFETVEAVKEILECVMNEFTEEDTVLNNGKSAWSGEEIEEGCISKEIMIKYV